MKNKTKYIIILIMLVLATAASIVLSFVSLNQACGQNQGCTIINTSKYETTLGIKNAHIGLIAFPILAILTILELKKSNKYRKKLLQIGIIVGSAFAIYFLYIQIFLLKALCKYCLVVDIGVLISLGVIFLKEKSK